MNLIDTENCPKHWDPDLYRMRPKCGCPDTERREGFVIYRDPNNAHNWILFDCKRWEWVAICGDWQTAMNTLYGKIAVIRKNRDNPENRYIVPGVDSRA